MPKHPIHTDSAPAAIGPYSQATRAGDTVYLSGQIPLDPRLRRADRRRFRCPHPPRLRQPGRGLRGRRRVAERHLQAERVPDRPGSLCRGQRDHGRVFLRALPGPGRGAGRRTSEGRGRGDGRHRPHSGLRRAAGTPMAEQSASVAPPPRLISELHGVGPAVAAKFKALGLLTETDLLFHRPLRYEDRTRITPIGNLAVDHGADRGRGDPPGRALFPAQEPAGGGRGRQRSGRAAVLQFLSQPEAPVRGRQSGALLRRGALRAGGLRDGASAVPGRPPRPRAAAAGSSFAGLPDHGRPRPGPACRTDSRDGRPSLEGPARPARPRWATWPASARWPTRWR